MFYILSFAGARCDQCAEGHFGNPNYPGGTCRRCECNGNIDPDEVGSCDKRTGQCLRCRFNTEGGSCERCQVGFYGDATLQNCQGEATTHKLSSYFINQELIASNGDPPWPSGYNAACSIRLIPISGLAWSIIKCAVLQKAVYGAFATERPLELFVMRREFIPGSECLSHWNMIFAVERDVKKQFHDCYKFEEFEPIHDESSL